MNRAIFLFMFCFSNILNIFFSFFTCSMHKNPHQNAGNGIEMEKKLYFSKFSWGACPLTPLEVLAPSARVGQIPKSAPPKFLSPYAYDLLRKHCFLSMFCHVSHRGQTRKHFLRNISSHEVKCCTTVFINIVLTCPIGKTMFLVLQTFENMCAN